MKQLLSFYVAIWRIRLARVCFYVGSKLIILGQRLLDSGR